MKIAVGSDHRGYEMKEQVKIIAAELGHESIDCGTSDSNPVDYPDTAYLAAKAVSTGQADRAVLICATGIGMCMAANKVPGIRAALCHDELTAEISRRHNNANVLCLASDVLGEELMRRIVCSWLGQTLSITSAMSPSKTSAFSERG